MLFISSFFKSSRFRKKIPIKGIERRRTTRMLKYPKCGFRKKIPIKGIESPAARSVSQEATLGFRKKIPIKGIERRSDHGLGKPCWAVWFRKKIPIKGIESRNTYDNFSALSIMIQKENPNKGNWKNSSIFITFFSNITKILQDFGNVREIFVFKSTADWLKFKQYKPY